MKKIKLTKGQFAIIDDEDFQRVSQYRWHAMQSKTDDFYAVSSFLRRKAGEIMLMHRFILNAPKEFLVDHINHNPLDNRKINLRLSTTNQNHMNIKKTKNKKSSIYKGVSFFKPFKKWRARIVINGKEKSLKYFNSEIAAAIAYDKAAKKYFGEFAYLNFNGAHHLMSIQKPQSGGM